MTARVDTILDAVPEGRVLDVGAVQHDASCADNDDWLHAKLLEVADEVVGIDILRDEVAVLRDQGYDIRVENAEIFDLGETFDAIVAGELIEHLANPGSFLERCRDHLRPGGRLIISTPNPWAFVHIRRAAVDRVRVNAEHTCWFGPRTLTQLINRHGFHGVQIRYIPPEHGVTRRLFDLDVDLLGATHLVATAWKPHYEPDEAESQRPMPDGGFLLGGDL